RLDDGGESVRVGLVWAGNPKHKNNRRRSLNPQLLAPLAEVAGVRWFSLQQGSSGGANVGFAVQLGPELTDFAETAAAIENLDLVITVDTAVAHLAGALGRPVWTLLPFAPDWRWMLDRSDTRWYPSMRLFRQPAPGDWTSVITEVASALEEVCAHRS